jgi:hypothetical protein
MRYVIPTAALLCTFLSFALAEDPDPPCMRTSLDEVGRLLMVPDGSGELDGPGYFTVTFLRPDCETPIAGAVIEVLVNGMADERTRPCDLWDAVKNTDENGTAAFRMLGGGCYKGEAAVVIRGNGVEMRRFDAVMSPDYAGWDNQGLAGRSDLAMTPVDLAAFIAAYRGGIGSASCHDYDNNGTTDPSDLAVFCKAYAGGSTSCDAMWPR